MREYIALLGVKWPIVAASALGVAIFVSWAFGWFGRFVVRSIGYSLFLFGTIVLAVICMRPRARKEAFFGVARDFMETNLASPEPGLLVLALICLAAGIYAAWRREP